jgi:hypothetical protein
LDARVITSIALLEVLWNISVLKMVTGLGGGDKGTGCRKSDFTFTGGRAFQIV